jgi:hypothetical protein
MSQRDGVPEYVHDLETYLRMCGALRAALGPLRQPPVLLLDPRQLGNQVHAREAPPRRPLRVVKSGNPLSGKTGIPVLASPAAELVRCPQCGGGTLAGRRCTKCGATPSTVRPIPTWSPQR